MKSTKTLSWKNGALAAKANRERFLALRVRVYAERTGTLRKGRIISLGALAGLQTGNMLAASVDRVMPAELRSYNLPKGGGDL